MRRDGTDALASGLLLVGLLACFAGAVDALGLSLLHDLFVSFMSGNTTSLGLAIGRHDLPRVLLILSLVAAFVSGAAGGTVLGQVAGRYHLPVLVAADAVVLAVPVLFPTSTVVSMAFAMGALNAAMERAGPVNVSITYVTGSLVKLGRGLGLWICGQERDADWVAQGVPWIGLLAGATIGSLSLARFGSVTIRWLPVVALALALICLASIPRKPGTDR